LAEDEVGDRHGRRAQREPRSALPRSHALDGRDVGDEAGEHRVCGILAPYGRDRQPARGFPRAAPASGALCSPAAMGGPPLLLDASDPRGWERAIGPAGDGARALLAAFAGETLTAARAALGPARPAAPAVVGALRALVAALHRAGGAPRR